MNLEEIVLSEKFLRQISSRSNVRGGVGGILQYFTNGLEEQLSVTQQIFTKKSRLLQHVYSIEELCHDQELSQQ